MAMSTAVASDATSNQINRITRDEFVQQGIDIVHAYAVDCHLSVVFPEHSPAQLAEWIWRRRADKNGTIPLLPQHIAVRLSDGQLRIMCRNSEDKPVFPVPDLTFDEVNSYRPVVPPDLDEAQPLPAPFLRSRHDRSDAAETSSEDEEEYSLPANGLPLDKFPSPPPDTHSPAILPIRNLAPSEFSSSPELVTPELDIAYPPREDGDSGIHGQKGVSHGILCKMLEQVRNKRRRIKRMLDDSQAELAQAVLELQNARNDLTFSIADSRKTLERLKQLFGTRRTLQVLDVIQRGREGRFRRSDFDNSDPPQNPTQDGSSQYDDESTDSRPDSWSSHASEPAINENIIVPNVTITAPSPANDATITANQNIDEQANEVVPSEVIAGAEVASQTHDTTIETPHRETGEQTGEFTVAPPSLAKAAAGDRRSNSYHLRGSSGGSSRKRTRDENEDSETEVERSILHNITPESSKRRRLTSTEKSKNTSRSKSKAGAGNRNAGEQRFAPKPKSGAKIAKDKRLRREDSVFLSTPSSFRLRHVRDRAKFAPLIAKLGLDEAEQPPSHPEGQSSSNPPRRPLTRSTSRIISYEDGGYLYVKH